MLEWEYVVVGTENSCELFCVKIFDYEWESAGKSARVKDPAYMQYHTGHVYKVNIENVEHEFLACEFSNGVWGFYLPKK
jgi:hypothetical protein